ncbi:radical SAM/SPASM domain-containing protein [Synechocystis sp. PCC 7338]|uniref:radical SAM protein n=1 Tax=Synechocystis sp. PCC 7338 TaxID=2732530 RepID=UPI001BAEE301|nr:radical SAM/SPASM domain-containing protein [Synechocystis sp. PCC 7338]QUS59322.1 radical SAM protein [Synechocystis sp. PCC 7338]
MLFKDKIKQILKDKIVFQNLYGAYQKIKEVQYSLSNLIKRTIESIKYANKPNYLYIEPINICNANCIFCAYQYDKREKKIQSFEGIQSVLKDYVESGGKSVDLTPFAGEIFINPEIISIIKKISSFREIQHISAYTNASLLHNVDLNELMQSGLTSLHVSVSPLDKKAYSKIYRSNFYSRVLKNIKNLLIVFGNSKNKTIKKIEISFRSDRSLKECKELPDYLEYVQPYLSKNVTVTSMSCFDSWSEMIQDEDLLPGMKLLHTKLSGKIEPCSRIYNTQILVDGSIRLCGCRFDNNASEDELYIGNISSIGLLDAYNSPKAQQIRNSFQEGKLLKICQHCSWYNK